MTQLGLIAGGPPRDDTGAVASDAYWTPQPLAVACVDDLVQAELLEDGDRVLEPSVGGGAFARAARKAGATWITGVDMHDVEGFAACDAAVRGDLLTARLGTFDVALGNPPFGGPDERRGRQPGDPPYVGAHHVLRCIEQADVVAMILPWEWGAVGYVLDTLLGPFPPAYRRPIRPRAWNVVRACGWYVWSCVDTSNRVLSALEWR